MSDEPGGADRGGMLARATRGLVVLGSIATAGMALWLAGVIAFVLPERDPARVPFWGAVAVGFLGFSALSGAWLIRRSRGASLVWSMRAASAVAVAAGLAGIARMIERANRGADFEAYVVLMGIILIGHGAAGALDTLISAPGPRSPGPV